ncbi:MAG: 2-oxo acid dehydrogenase subunit E2 [Cryobacterium sp.]|nr:2-oxo acid dehydrogenase subunit E2 [Cryobacterium sp.]MBX3103549.1 2-oxo acid dehydrogenase subunit E2 [Cryobacterium sp.]
MSESVNLPALGESVTEGTVTRWLKKVGDRVEVDEPLVEVSTDKVDTEIPSPIAGILEEILVNEDETVDVGTPLARVGDGSGVGGAPEQPSESAAEPVAEVVAEPVTEVASAPVAEVPVEPVLEPPVQAASGPSVEPLAETPIEPVTPSVVYDVSEPEPVAEPIRTTTPIAQFQQEVSEVPGAEPVAPVAEETSSAPTETSVQPSANSGYITPIVRKLANESGIDLSTVSGSGVGGRIRKQDVILAASGATPTKFKKLETSPLRGTSVPMSRLRKVIAERAVISMQSSAQLTTVVEADVTALAAFRDEVKDAFLAKVGTKLSFLPFFTFAAAEALKAFPIINAQIDGDSITYPGQENISIAVDTERGLLTPVIRNAGELTVAQIGAEIADLADRTRGNSLKPDELAGGTFTVTNTGSRGALFDTPLVFLPQVAILGTGVVTKRPVVVTDNGLDAIAIRSLVYLALSYDHRIVDGADAARFLSAVKSRLESGDFASVMGLS